MIKLIPKYLPGNKVVVLPNVTVQANYPSEESIKNTIENRWASAKNLTPYRITKDPTFTRLRTGAGSIEYYNADTPYINYGTEENPNIIKNPNLGESTLVFDPNTNTVDDILMDLLHHYRATDPLYLLYLETYTNALMSNPDTNDSVFWNSNLGKNFRNSHYEKDKKGNIKKDSKGNPILKWNRKNKKDWSALVKLNQNNLEYLILGVDGTLRDLMASDYMREHSNYLTKENAEKLWLAAPEIKLAYLNLYNYLTTGK